MAPAPTKYYAHTVEGRGRETWQTLEAHLADVAAKADRHATKFNAAEFGHVAGLLHDLGKYSDKFQRKLDGVEARVDHSTAGAQVISEAWGQAGLLIAAGIAGHHAGLADGTTFQGSRPERGLLDARLQLRPPQIENYDAWKGQVSLTAKQIMPSLKLHSNATIRDARFGLTMSQFARMIFSCLVDADRIDTEGFTSQFEDKHPERGDWTALPEIRDELDRALAALQSGATVSDVNLRRAEILAAARLRAMERPGLFTLTVPTGGGKTLASLAFALNHAIQHGLDRIIYVIPYTSIIEQTADVFRRSLGPHANCILEHHSTFDEAVLRSAKSEGDETEQDGRGVRKLQLASENWDAPIVVTTAVQFFESLFSSRPSSCRKLHNIANSVVILDEAQTLPLNLLRPCVAILDELARNYKTSIVLCTATQPALLETADKNRSFEGGFPEADVREIAPEPVQLAQQLQRVKVENLKELDDTGLIERLAAHRQVLCIVNTRAHARELYQGLKPHGDAYHLSALMCPAHRGQRLAEIRKQLLDKEPCRLIATSLIESGVDIDFPAVYRAVNGLDAIAQAAGRCNREGKRNADECVVYVFDPGEKRVPQPMRKFADGAREILRRYPEAPLSQEALNEYFAGLYWRMSAGREDQLDKHGILQRMNERAKDMLFPFESIARDFRLIDGGLLPVLIPFDDNAKRLLEELEHTDRIGAIARKLNRYAVNVPRGAFIALKDVDSIQQVAQERFGEQFWKLESESLYTEEFGLNSTDPTFISVEKLTSM